LVDVREDILARLLEVVATIPNIRSAYRNNTEVAENQKPAVVVLDGDEEANDSGNRPSGSPIIMQLTPGILVLDIAAMAGPAVSLMRVELIKRVLFDTELNNLITRSAPRGEGAIRYLGCQTYPGWLRDQFVSMAAQFSFKYALRPEQL